MFVKFRCEKCGRLLSAEADAGMKFKCPHCGARLIVPAGLASLPAPKIAGNSVPTNVLKDADEPFEEQEPADNRIYSILAYGMPWVLSVFMHAGLFLLAMFVVFIVATSQPKPKGIPIPDAFLNTENPGGVMRPGVGGDINMNPAAPIRSESRGFSRREGKVAMDGTGETGNIDLIGLSSGGLSGGGGLVDLGMSSGGSNAGPKSAFYGINGQAYQVVYVIDRSGSMINTFDFLRKELLTSIGHLKDSQDFHVIFFSSGTPMENPPKQLIPANRQNKLMAAEFLKNVTPEGQTDPVPAIRRAFDTLQGARKTGKLVYLLSDGVFPDNKAVLNVLQERNPEGSNQAMICTFLYGQRPREAEDVMQKIARENRGRYRFINPDFD